MIERQLGRYRRLLYGATDAMLVEGLRRIIQELEEKLALAEGGAELRPAEPADPDPSRQRSLTGT